MLYLRWYFATWVLFSFLCVAGFFLWFLLVQGTESGQVGYQFSPVSIFFGNDNMISNHPNPYTGNSYTINTLRLRQDGRHVANDIFKCIFLNKNVWFRIRTPPKFVPKRLFNNIPALVQIMAWRRSYNKPLSVPMMVSLPMHICVTRPQWVKITSLCWNVPKLAARAHEMGWIVINEKKTFLFECLAHHRTEIYTVYHLQLNIVHLFTWWLY